MTQNTQFSTALLKWFDQHGRKNLPWQIKPTPYRVWISEIMLQQTQVDTVIPYFRRFMERFPDLDSLANASQDDVLSHWSGLGYYARARNLHKTAQQVQTDHDGELPANQAALESLPGIGRSTAGAILSLAFKQRAAILDGNVKRVLARYHTVDGWPGQSKVSQQLWALAEEHTPDARSAAYTQAIMDLGATLCTRTKPNCQACPMCENCKAQLQDSPQSWPGKKPKKAKPSKTRLFLLLENPDREILLIRRPQTGIWGGLWSLPELDEKSNVTEVLENSFQLNLKSQQPLEEIKHQFTHFELRILPVYGIVENIPGIKEIATDTALWYKTDHAPPGGLPTPVTRLLAQHQAQTLQIKRKTP